MEGESVLRSTSTVVADEAEALGEDSETPSRASSSGGKSARRSSYLKEMSGIADTLGLSFGSNKVVATPRPVRYFGIRDELLQTSRVMNWAGMVDDLRAGLPEESHAVVECIVHVYERLSNVCEDYDNSSVRCRCPPFTQCAEYIYLGGNCPEAAEYNLAALREVLISWLVFLSGTLIALTVLPSFSVTDRAGQTGRGRRLMRLKQQFFVLSDNMLTIGHSRLINEGLKFVGTSNVGAKALQFVIETFERCSAKVMEMRAATDLPVGVLGCLQLAQSVHRSAFLCLLYSGLRHRLFIPLTMDDDTLQSYIDVTQEVYGHNVTPRHRPSNSRKKDRSTKSFQGTLSRNLTRAFQKLASSVIREESLFKEDPASCCAALRLRDEHRSRLRGLRGGGMGRYKRRTRLSGARVDTCLSNLSKAGYYQQVYGTATCWVGRKRETFPDNDLPPVEESWPGLTWIKQAVESLLFGELLCLKPSLKPQHELCTSFGDIRKWFSPRHADILSMLRGGLGVRFWDLIRTNTWGPSLWIDDDKWAPIGMKLIDADGMLTIGKGPVAMRMELRPSTDPELSGRIINCIAAADVDHALLVRDDNLIREVTLRVSPQVIAVKLTETGFKSADDLLTVRVTNPALEFDLSEKQEQGSSSYDVNFTIEARRSNTHGMLVVITVVEATVRAVSITDGYSASAHSTTLVAHRQFIPFSIE